ncbi:hypothetical protein BX616_009807 [Lobosporangium transversale]|uniref:Glycosyl transferase family 28 C-terminal domain-containing protein n=1 Tax=Lobosporangium transversale TaxID=64571 RepID=A0A1Y2GYS7_9FUNG|nr:hypothetical protein BCR41DRAFT_346781 [Lobosporangium transversale]KAF9913628.1 hypothetical protein BX616_009807 [Lobosporangium transversale]ORZ27437.1 hypothetical protein BCR41DRAFT_346781 [Lobosporangium transversale]|eukprot:XP_021885164.1 hypothetical protein BCR41DRAFT_346781 [Lobosporangium transversale]
MAPKGYTFCYYVSGHGFGHATRVNQIITELLHSSTSSVSTAVSDGPLTSVKGSNSTSGSTEGLFVNSSAAEPVPTATTTITTTITRTISRHTIYIVSDAPQFIFQDVIALGAIYRNAKVDSGVVQPLAYSVDRQKTIEGVKSFLAKREEMIKHEVSWLAQVGANCVLADAPFLPCAAAYAYGIPACLITNFTFDEVYRFLREGDPMDRDVIACADAALEDYKKASLLLRLPGSIDIPSFADEILTLESGVPLTVRKPFVGNANEQGINNAALDKTDQQPQQNGNDQYDLIHRMDSQLHLHSSRRNPPLSIDTSTAVPKHTGMQRRAIDVPLVVRKAINTREDVLRSLGVDEETIRTKKMVLVSFGGQRLKQGWGNPLPDGWIGVICGLPVSHELPDGFYRSPHGVYVPDLTHAADIVIGKLGYGTCSECIAHDTPLIYVSRPQFVEEHGLIKLMINHGLPVEMTAEEFETGLWQRSILEADRLAQEEKEGRRLYLEALHEEEIEKNQKSIHHNIDQESAGIPQLEKTMPDHDQEHNHYVRRRSSIAYGNPLQRRASKAKSLAESVNMAEMARGGPISPPIHDDDLPLLSPARSRRSASITSLTSATFRSRTINHNDSDPAAGAVIPGGRQDPCLDASMPSVPRPAWFERRIPHDGGKVCAQLVEEYMRIWEEHHRS